MFSFAREGNLPTYEDQQRVNVVGKITDRILVVAQHVFLNPIPGLRFRGIL